MDRCFDCLDDIPESAPHFAVLKPLALPLELGEPLDMSEACVFDPVVICGDCAGWYGDEAFDLSEEVL